mgnify:CR=1 FL=1
MAYLTASACAPICVLPSFNAKLLPSGGFTGNKPNGSIGEGRVRELNVCLLFVGGDGVTVIRAVLKINIIRTNGNIGTAVRKKRFGL